MTNNFKIGDKFLLPGSLIAGNWLSIPCKGGSFQFKYNMFDMNEFAIPASTLTDLQAENARLKMALVSIRDMLEQPNHRDVLPEMIYQTAVKTLGGE